MEPAFARASCLVAVALGAILTGPVAVAAERALAAAGCMLEPGERGIVAEVPDAVTLKLANGLMVLLAGIAAPLPPLDEAGPGATEAESARKVLAAIALGRPVELRYSRPRRDRYGRARAHVFVLGAGENASVSAALVEAGYALVRGSRDDRACLAGLLDSERTGRTNRAGLWNNRIFKISRAADPSLRERNGLYSLVEGRPVSVGRTERFVYLNFGRDWSTDFTVTIATSDLGSFETEGPIERLDQALLRVRGQISEYGGPTMRLTHPEQVEIVDGAGLSAADGIR